MRIINKLKDKLKEKKCKKCKKCIYYDIHYINYDDCAEKSSNQCMIKEIKNEMS